MKIYITLLVFILIGCQSESENKTVHTSNLLRNEIKSDEIETFDEAEKRFRDSLYSRESDNYISKLEEVPNRDTDAYKLTISLKNGKRSFSKFLDTRPRASLINYCNDIYTVVGFSCGGPCFSQVFVFTDENRPTEQFDYARSIAEHPNFITHIKNEEFDRLIVHNFDNGEELVIVNPDIDWWNYGQMDTMYINGKDLKIEYHTEKNNTRKKTISLQKIID
jgi:hypothetical protein